MFNNEEDDRSGMSSNVNDRPAWELYYRAFQGSVDAGVGSAMCRCVHIVYDCFSRCISCIIAFPGAYLLLLFYQS